MKKLKVYHFHNCSGGGVLSVINNLFRYQQHDEIENHIIYTIDKNSNTEYAIPSVIGAASEQFFYYSSKWNFYYTSKKLSKLFPKEAVLIAHDWLELGMVSALGLQNKVIQFLHGDYAYYYELAKKHKDSIDCFITVSQSIKTTLEKFVAVKDVCYLRFPVNHVVSSEKKHAIPSVVFIGRGERAKGFNLLPEIASLIDKRMKVKWEIFGKISDECKYIHWPSSVLVNFHEDMHKERLLNLLAEYDYFILPSLAEGMPVSLVESMKGGLIPLVNDIEGGIQELVHNDQTGYKIKDNDVCEYAEKIVEIEENPVLKDKLKSNCISLSNKLFDPEINTSLIEKKILDVAKRTITTKKSFKVYGSRLDHKWMPNFITKQLRFFK